MSSALAWGGDVGKVVWDGQVSRVKIIQPAGKGEGGGKIKGSGRNEKEQIGHLALQDGRMGHRHYLTENQT